MILEACDQAPIAVHRAGDLRLGCKSPCQGNTLCLASAKLAGAAILEAWHLNEVKQLGYAWLNIALLQSPALERVRDIFANRLVRKQSAALKDKVSGAKIRREVCDVPVADDDPAAVGPLESCNYPKERRLSTTTWAEERHELPFPDIQTYIVNRDDRSKGASDLLDSDEGLTHGLE